MKLAILTLLMMVNAAAWGQYVGVDPQVRDILIRGEIQYLEDDIEALQDQVRELSGVRKRARASVGYRTQPPTTDGYVAARKHAHDYYYANDPVYRVLWQVERFAADAAARRAQSPNVEATDPRQ